MDLNSQWLLIGVPSCVLAAWLGYRAYRRAERNQQSRRAHAELARRVAVQRVAADTAAREKAVRQATTAEASTRAAAARLQEAKAARVQAGRRAAEAATNAAAERLAREDAARDAARLEAARIEGARVEVARVEAVLRAADEVARIAMDRAAARDANRDEALPADAVARAHATLPPAGPAVPKTPSQTLIMVADDSKIVRVKTGRLLAQHHYQVSYAVDGLDAARQLQVGAPDIVITDVEMPGMDGFELTRHVRANPLTAHIPIIMITAADDRHREDADRAGVSVLLGKPYREEALIDHIRTAMQPDARPAAPRPAA